MNHELTNGSINYVNIIRYKAVLLLILMCFINYLAIDFIDLNRQWNALALL